jgi:hypothetical protein
MGRQLQIPIYPDDYPKYVGEQVKPHSITTLCIARQGNGLKLKSVQAFIFKDRVKNFRKLA